MRSKRSRGACCWVCGSLIAAVLVPRAVSAQHGTCVGDCGGDGSVTVDEIIVGVNIALGLAPVEACPSVDRDGNFQVTIDELVGAILNALEGCPMVPTATPTPSCTPGTPTPIECTSPPCPDLVGQVVSYTFPLSRGCDQPLEGMFTITVCARNQGEAPAGPFHVSASDHFFDEVAFDGLAAGAQDCRVQPLHSIGGYGVLSVDSRSEVAESNEGNNSSEFFVAALSATPSCTARATPTPSPTPPSQRNLNSPN